MAVTPLILETKIAAQMAVAIREQREEAARHQARLSNLQHRPAPPVAQCSYCGVRGVPVGVCLQCGAPMGRGGL